MSVGYEEGVYKAVLDTLVAAQAAGHNLAFVRNVSPGAYPKMTSLSPQAYPLIVFEPGDDDEKFFTTGTPPAITSGFKIDIHLLVLEGSPGAGYFGAPTADPPRTGLFEFVRQVKQTLQADFSRGVQPLMGAPGLQKVAFPKTAFSYEFYPIRLATITGLFSGQLTTDSH